jgi:hypothetical protein
MILSGGIGFVAGLAGMVAFLHFGGDLTLEDDRLGAGAVGFVYLMAGAFTLFGAAWPGVGAKVLNVSDVDELIEQRAILMGSAVSVLAFGVMLLCLAGAGPGGVVPDWAAIAAVVAAFAISAVIYFRQWRLYDELWRKLSWESSAYALMLLFPVLIVWGGAVQLGYLAAMQPLGVVALTAGTLLAGAVIATGRRGLLAPR